MDIKTLSQKAREIKTAYDKANKIQGRNTWHLSEYSQGLVGDVGDLLKLILAHNNFSDSKDLDAKIRHELADCLWSVLIIADELGIDLEKEFLINIGYLKQKLHEIIEG